ncbi:PqiB family protein [Endozoicomonas sp. OPT23]|uniref:PqiB family protein n=1 Tax=Endozoicomonas sp. OPT23 TaxID=2072845 RepID=UPI00189159EB|nr:MlaD family protein [Endozoicomonas sp. OPT23]
MAEQFPAADARVVRRRNVSIVWLLPLIALCVVGYLVWSAAYARHIEVHVFFNSAEGIKKGTTEVRYNGLAIGRVASMQMTDDLKAVDVTLEIDRNMDKFLLEKSRFWLVRPQVTVAGVSGLETLVSGNYIAFSPEQKGKKSRLFEALKFPPRSAIGGLNLTLKTSELSSIQNGSPVYYRRLKVGEVTGYKLTKDDEHVAVQINIKPQFGHLVRKNTRFWNAGGVDVSGSFPNLKIRTQSLLSIVQGGIAFYTPDWEPGTDVAEEGSGYQLYSDYDAAEAGFKVSIEFPLDVAFSQEKTRILFHGKEVGLIRETRFNEDYSAIITEAVIRPEARSLMVEGARFWRVKPQIGLKGVTGLETLLGGQYIALDINHSDVKNAKFKDRFKGLASKPPAALSTPGLHLTLIARSLSGISHGSPVLYRKMPVGSVQSHELNDDGVTIQVLIDPQYSHLVNSSTVFWNASGITLEGDFQGLKVKTGTLGSILAGGIEFMTPEPDVKAVANKEVFSIYDDADQALENGTVIDVWFESAVGLKQGTLLKYRGLEMGRVTRLELDKKREGVQATILLKESAGWIARSGTRFWLVKPKLGLTSTTNLETLITGFYIGMSPAKKANSKEISFFHADRSPPDDMALASGLRLELVSPKLGSVRKDNPVYYREIPVGKVTGYRLDNPASQVVIYINIEDRFASLVTAESQFWNASGVDINVGLFSGARIRTESLESLLAGGISFATPEVADGVGQNSRFKLHEKSVNEWLKWAPPIEL